MSHDAALTIAGTPVSYTHLDVYKRQGKLVYGRLSAALTQGQLQPDARLKIRDLAEAMGTSVTPVRDAVLQLVQEGALIMRSPRDIRVRRVSRKEYLEIRDIRVEPVSYTHLDVYKRQPLPRATKSALHLVGNKQSACGPNFAGASGQNQI